MGSAVLQCFIVFLLHLLISSGSSVAEKPPLEAIHEKRKLDSHGNRILFSPSFTATELDTTSGNIPIVNPTTPSTTPTVNPMYPPAPPTEPIPTPATPTTTPTTPTTTPTTPTTTPTTPTTPSSTGSQWCIASPTASQTALQVALDYACGYGGADCSAIQPGGSCYNPTTVRDHASYAFNDYYRKNPAPTSCVFGGTAQLTSTDPSNGSCRYPSASTSTSISPPSPPAISTPTITPPTATTTPTTTVPGGPTVYGAAEPTGLPSSAVSVSCSLLLLFTATGLVGPLLAANYLQADGN